MCVALCPTSCLTQLTSVPQSSTMPILQGVRKRARSQEASLQVAVYDDGMDISKAALIDREIPLAPV